MQDAWEQRRERDDICGLTGGVGEVLDALANLLGDVGRASGVFIDTPSAMTVPTLGAPKGSTARYGLVREAAEAFDGELCDVSFEG